MFTTLLESRAVRVRRARSTAMSVLLHGALAATVVGVTLRTPRSVGATPLPQDITYIRPISSQSHMRPATPTPASPVAPVLPTPMLIIAPPVSDASHIILTEGPMVPVDHLTIGVGAQVTAPPGATGVSGIESGTGAVDVAYVEKIPRLIGNAPPPSYPLTLRYTGITGHVIVRFVVDTLGRAEMGSLDLLEATHALFADAVRDAVGRYRFSPGEVTGRRVRTMVQLPFTFMLR